MVHHLPKIALTTVGFTALLLTAACDRQAPPTSVSVEVKTLAPFNANAVNQTFKNRFVKMGKPLKENVSILSRDTLAFLRSPGDETLEAARLAWQEAHNNYLSLTPGFLWHKEAESDDEDGEIVDLRFNIDAWPIQPGFMDSLPGYPNSGITSEISLNIDEVTLRRQHGITDPEEVCLGFHAIEYLLFSRPLEDFDPTTTTVTTVRRRELLELQVQVLEKDIVAMLAGVPGQYDTDEDFTPSQLTSLLLSNLMASTDKMFREANAVLEDDGGHSAFSGNPELTLTNELKSLADFTTESPSVFAELEQLNKTDASNLKQTLTQAVSALENPEDPERIKLPLMMTAIRHQLETFYHELEMREP